MNPILEPINRLNHSVAYQQLIPFLTVLAFTAFIYYTYKNRKKILEDIKEFNRTDITIILSITVLAGILRFLVSQPYHAEYIYSAIGHTIQNTGRYGYCIVEEYCFPTRKPYSLLPSLIALINYAFNTVSLNTGRFLNMLAGTLTIPIGALAVKKVFKSRLKPIVFAGFLALLPLHVQQTTNIETHAFSILFLTTTVYLLTVLKNERNQEWLGLTLLSYLLAVLSKPLNILLLIPIIYTVWDDKEDILKQKTNPFFVGVILTGIAFIPLKIHFFFIDGVIKKVGYGVLTKDAWQALLIKNPFIIFIVGSMVLGATYSVIRKNKKDLLLIPLYLVPLILNTNVQPHRLFLPVQFLLLLPVATLFTDITEKLFPKKHRVKVVVVLIILLTVFYSFNASINYKNLFSEEEKLDNYLLEAESNGYSLWSDNAELAFSVSKSSVTDLNYIYPEKFEEEKIAFFTRDPCLNIHRLEDQLEDYSFENQKDIGLDYRLCYYTKK